MVAQMAENVNTYFMLENERILLGKLEYFCKFVYLSYPFGKMQIEIMEIMNWFSVYFGVR